MWDKYRFNENDAMCSKTSINFIDSIWEILGGLLAGAKTIMLSDEFDHSPYKLANVMNESKVTRITFVPTLLNELIKCGNSLKIMQLILRIKKKSNVEISLQAIFNKIYVKSMAKLIEDTLVDNVVSEVS